ncbi:hypothetical protein LOZ63_002180 [Ophidiomyces ophidiicola]|nr:hypothetical protein LOZ36_000654 [Ophidiomyces ophidiicola]KAI2419768.1 hypothetical protein LOZ63_002180 [Ophidiomyces ophidiicola]
MKSDEGQEPIAIVGAACRLPGGVNNVGEFWEFLMDGRSGYCDMPSNRMNMEAWHHPEGVRPGSIVSKGGFFVQHDVDNFDNSFFGISAVEAGSMDPAQKQLLEVAFEALESTGLSLEQLRGSNTGVYVGNFGLDQALMALRDPEYLSPYTSTGTGGTILSNRISYVFDLKGPSFTLDTACSSSLYALHLACMGLQNGDCTGALVCAANAIRSVEGHLMSSRLGAISATSKCHTFDSSADGYARADGFGAIYVARLSDAIRSGMPIRAVIRGTAIGANGTGVGLTHPDSAGQAKVIRKAYSNAGISDLSQTGYFECHGTGTPVGDPIETHSIGSVFSSTRVQDDPLLIGSVKSNLGHSEAAAGISSLIKTALAIQKKIIPGTIGVENVNPAIKLDEWKLKIVTNASPWPANIPIRRASVNSFGYGGANAHVILEALESVLPLLKAAIPWPLIGGVRLDNQESSIASENGADSPSGRTYSTPLSSEPNENGLDVDDLPKVILFSAKNRNSLENMTQIVKEQVITRRPGDIAHTLGKRSKFTHRAVAIVKSGCEPQFTTGETPKETKLGFIFTGQGAQWPQMGKDLLKFPVFQESVHKIDLALSSLPLAPSWTVEEMILAELTPAEMDEPRVAQIMSIAVEIALIDLLADWNIHPTIVAGHSAGEIAAAYCAGYLTRAEAVAVAYYRGRAVSETTQPPGGMLAVGISGEEAEKIVPLNKSVVIGAINSPRSVTLSGDADAITAIKEDMDSRKIFNRLLATKGRAYHSPHMESAAEAYTIPLHNVQRDEQRPEIKAQYFSTVLGSLWTEKEIPMSYWRRNMESPVLFHPAISKMRDAGMTHALEIGPHSTLRSPILDIIKASSLKIPFQYIGAMKRGEDCIQTVLNACAELCLSGFKANLDHVNGGGSFIVDFPSYGWDHSMKFVTENRADREMRLRPFARHDLLGSKTPGTALSIHVWRNILSLNNVPWLMDHKVGEHYIFPAAGFMSMAVEAARQVKENDADAFVLEDVSIGTALMVDNEIEIFLTMKKQHLGSTTVSNIWWEFNVSSVKDGISTEHAKGRISYQVESKQHKLPVLSESALPFRQRIPESYWYDDATKAKGLVFGTSFKRISNIFLDSKEHRATADMVTETTPEMTGMKFESQYVVHPTVLDNCLQLSVLAAGKSSSSQAYVPVGVSRLTILEKRGEHDHAKLESSGRYIGFKGMHGSAQLRNPDTNEVMISLQGLRFVGIPASGDAVIPSKREVFWRLVWDDDYNAIAKRNDEVYFPEEKYWPKQYNYPRKRRVRLVQMAIRRFSQKYPELMTIEPVNVENKHFIEWAHWLLEGMKKECLGIYHMDPEELDIEIEKERPFAPPGTEWTWALYENLHRIISGEISVLDIATNDEMLGKFYATQLIYDKFKRAIEILGYKYPNMRILEIGAGTGSATELVLKALTKGGTKRYSSYYYTDISTSFFIHASDKFSQYEDIEYKLYDMEKDPEEQGYEAESFDLVIASCTVHVTANITNALQSIRKLLKVGGKILLSEITAEWHDQTFAMGLLPGFYKGYDEGRTRHPFWTPDQWEEAFPKAHFSSLELSVNDIPEDHGFTVLSASALPMTTSAEEIQPQREQTITVVHLSEPTQVSGHIEKLAIEQGLSVQHRRLVAEGLEKSEEWEGSGRIIVLAELERYIWSKIADQEWTEFQKMMRTAESILWVTQGGLMAGDEPEASLINGFFQCLDINPQMRVASMDFEKKAARDENMAWEILYRESLLPKEIDKQFRQQNGKWLVSRLLPDERLVEDFGRSQGIDQNAVATPLKELGPVQIGTTDPGRLTALVFRPDTSLRESLKAGYVEVEVKAVGMNMVELSALTGGYDTDDLSSEFSGIVTQIGHGVRDVMVGDRVFGMYAGKFGNITRVPAAVCQKARDTNDTFEQLVSLPSAYCTAWYAMVTVGRIQPGETVLIQSATGGFGMAAIAIARFHGADIYVTAGSVAKRKLLEDMGIAADHIFSSREISAFTDLKAATNGQGFDLVLNTASGDYFREVSWPLVAPFGRFVELKKNDIVDNGNISLKKFNEGVTFIAVDMHYLCDRKPEILIGLMKTIGALYRARQIDPLPVKSYPISEIANAYTEFSRFQHTGKLALSYNPEDLIPFVPEPSAVEFQPNAAYLIAGGLRGIGSFLSRWMVRQGAKHLVFLARSAVEGEAQETVDHLREMGAVVHAVQGSVCVKEDVKKAFEISGLPIRGVVNSALVLRNKDFARLTAEEVHDTFHPKIEGNIYLYEVAQELGVTLDFFVMLSSLTSVSHAATQASYSAANCFMDEYARYLRKRSVPATSIALGVIGDAGFMSRNQHNMMHLMRNGHYVTLGHELMEQFGTALFRQEPTDAWGLENPIALGTEPAKLGALVDTGNVPEPLWDRDARWGVIGIHATRKGQNDGSGKSGLNGASKVLDMVVERLAKLLWMPVENLNPEVSLASLGIDSMIASEFRHWVYQTFKKNVSMMEMLAQDMTAEKLSEILEG